MIGINRRKRTEGWALDVDELEVNSPHSSLRQKLGEDNRLWLIVAGVIIVLTFSMIMNLYAKGDKPVTDKRPAVSSGKVSTD